MRKLKDERERELETLLKAGATILHADREDRESREAPLHYKVVQKSYLNRDRRLRLIIGTVRSRGAREKKLQKTVRWGWGWWEAITVLQILGWKKVKTVMVEFEAGRVGVCVCVQGECLGKLWSTAWGTQHVNAWKIMRYEQQMWTSAFYLLLDYAELNQVIMCTMCDSCEACQLLGFPWSQVFQKRSNLLSYRGCKRTVSVVLWSPENACKMPAKMDLHLKNLGNSREK